MFDFHDGAVNILGLIMTFFGVFDAVKYHWNTSKIRKAQSSREHSRMFLNVALFNDFARILYGLCKPDWYVLASALLATVFMLECWWAIYQYYPYRYRNLKNFKRPNVFAYFVNSLLPNSIRKRL